MEHAIEIVGVNSQLTRIILQGCQEGLAMTGIEPVPVGASKMLQSSRNISVLVGLLGDYHGTMTMNLSNVAAATLSGRLLGEPDAAFSDETLDGIGELGNMIAGRIKDLMADHEMAFRNIGCPSVVMGASYDLYYTSGFTTSTVEFEIEEIPVIEFDDRIFTVSVSLMKR